jgi:hypothetical protein
MLECWDAGAPSGQIGQYDIGNDAMSGALAREFGFV